MITMAGCPAHAESAELKQDLRRSLFAQKNQASLKKTEPRKTLERTD